MKRSTDRILTTHMGSLPRPDVLADLLVAQAEGKPVDAARIPALTDEAMDHIVRRQLDCGIDVGNDGEMPRSTFFGYLRQLRRHRRARPAATAPRHARPAAAGHDHPRRRSGAPTWRSGFRNRREHGARVRLSVGRPGAFRQGCARQGELSP
jgi:hypothetical protein